MRADNDDDSYWMQIARQFNKHLLGRFALWVVIAFCLVGIYAPFLASSKPLFVEYDGEWFFPLFRYLFYRGFFTKRLDIFFNLLIFTMPLFVLSFFFRKHLFKSLTSLFILQTVLFLYFAYSHSRNPAFDPSLKRTHSVSTWNEELATLSPYARLNLVLRYQQRKQQHERLEKFAPLYHATSAKKRLFNGLPTLWQVERENEDSEIQRLKGSPNNQAAINYILDRRQWLESQLPLLHHEIMPLLRPFHWEDDAGGDEALNRIIPFWETTRINGKDLVAALIFGVRISLVVGILSVALALAIGLPIGAFAGFYGGTFDIIVSRLLEVWEAMPTFFMLLMVVAILQSKSIFLVIAIIGIFGWTTFSRYIRGEFFKQRNLPYTEACRAIGLSNSQIIFSHILPNAIPPVLTLLPFAIMGAITSEAGLSFLGLGEEGSCSWGVLMDEGRAAFPSQSYLLWPPAILLTILLVAIALVGDSLRDALDPKMHR